MQRNNYGEVIEEFEPLRSSGPVQIRVRVMRGSDGVYRLDLRMWIDTKDYKGFTQKGVSLTVAEFERLANRGDHILRIMRSNLTTTNGESR